MALEDKKVKIGVHRTISTGGDFWGVTAFDLDTGKQTGIARVPTNHDVDGSKKEAMKKARAAKKKLVAKGIPKENIKIQSSSSAPGGGKKRRRR